MSTAEDLLDVFQAFFQALSGQATPSSAALSLISQIETIHAHSARGVIEEIGVGVLTQELLLAVSGASNTLLKGQSTYAKSEQDKSYHLSQRSVSKKSVEAMAEILLQEHNTADFALVISGSCSTLDELQGGDNHFWMALATRKNAWVLHARLLPLDRIRQHICVAFLAIALLEHALKNPCFKGFPPLLAPLKEALHLDVFAASADHQLEYVLRHLELLNQDFTPLIFFESQEQNLEVCRYLEKCRGEKLLLQKGAFNPPTLAHQAMMSKCLEEIAEAVLPLSEISLNNADKDLKSLENIAHRILMLSSFGWPICVTKQTTLYETRELFEKYTQAQGLSFICGEDLFRRLFYPKYYQHLDGGLKEGLERLFVKGTQLYVFERETDLAKDPESRAMEAYYQQQITPIPLQMPFSSSLIRSQLQVQTKGWDKMLLPEVAAYIQEHQLYRQS